MEGKKLTRSNSQQLQKLTEYMSLHKNFANGEYTGPLGARQNLRQWEELKELLREVGPDKTVEQWKQTWRDLKRKARRANAVASTARAQTGNIYHVPMVSESNSLILDTIGHECSTGFGPAETAIGANVVVEFLDTEDVYMPPPPPEFATPATTPATASSSIAAPLPLPQSPALFTAPRLTPQPPNRRRRRRQTPITQASAFLSLAQEQHQLLNRLCDLFETQNKILAEQNEILKKNQINNQGE